MKKYSYLMVLFLLFFNTQAFSQSYFDDDKSTLWNDDRYEDADFLDSDIDDEYIDVDEQEAFDAKIAAQKERNKVKVYSSQDASNLLKPNVTYGALTGLLVGGWFALNTQTSARDNFRYIGSGLMLGALMGLFVGSKPLRKNNARLGLNNSLNNSNNFLLDTQVVKNNLNTIALYNYSKNF